MPWASKEKRAEYQRRYRAAKKAIDPDFENRRARAYRAADPAYKALYYFRIRFRQWIKGNKGVSVRDLVG